MDVWLPSIEILDPLITLDVRMQNKRTSQAREMKVKVSDFARRKYQDVPRLKLDYQAQFIENNLTALPMTKRHDGAEEFVDPVPMCISGDAQVDDQSSKWIRDWYVRKPETLAVRLYFLVLLRKVVLHLQEFILNLKEMM